MSKTEKTSRSPGINPHARPCAATSKKTGKPCANPAVAGSDFCRMHGGKGLEVAEATSETNAKAQKTDQANSSHRRGARPGNKNAVTHGAYALTLLPEEQAIYEQKQAQFLAEIGAADVFDRQVIHVLSLIAAKLDLAAAKGAPAEALIPISNEILKLLRSLKETRDSRDVREENLPRTAADFLNELIERDRERGVTVSEEALLTRVYELEREINDLRTRLNMEPRPDIAHRMDTCSHCRRETEQRLKANSLWVCLRCGWAMEERKADIETHTVEESAIPQTSVSELNGD